MCAGRWFGMVGVALLLLLMPAAAEAISSDAQIQVEIADDLSSLEGTVRWQIKNTSAGPIERIPFWCFPERLRHAPEGMDEVSREWVFPERSNPGGMRLGAVQDAGGRSLDVQGEGVIQWVHLPVPLAPGASTAVSIQFMVDVPHRFGPFGHAEGQLTLDGGWFPRPPPMTTGGFVTDAPPGDLAYQVKVNWRGESAVVALLNGQMTALGGGVAGHVLGKGVAARVTMVLMTRHEVSRFSTPETHLLMVHRRPRHRRARHPGLDDLGHVDVHGQVLGTAAAGVRALSGHKAWVPERRVVIVEAPLRRDLAIGAPGMILVSDRIFEIMPREGFRKLHRFALLRGLYTTLWMARVFQKEPVVLRDRVLDLVALDFTSRWEQAVYHHRQDARDVMAPASFMAAVDEVIHAPQSPFASQLFRVPDDTDPFRDRLTLFSHRSPNGRRLYEGLVDLGGRARVDAVIDSMLWQDGVTFTEALRRHLPEATDAYVRGFDGPMPRRDYRLGQRAVGVDAVGPWLDVEVLCEGDCVAARVVTVSVGGWEGAWRGGGPRGVVRFRPASELDPAGLEPQVDPRRRRVESDMDRSVHPRANNQRTHPWRFLIQGLNVSAGTAEGRLNGVLTAAIRQDFNLTHSFYLQAYELPRRLGLATTWVIGFGPKLRPNRRAYSASVSVDLDYLKPADLRPPGFGARLGVAVGRVSYLSRHNPGSGGRLSAAAGLLLAADRLETRLGGYVDLHAAHLWEVAEGQVLGGQLRLSSYFGGTSNSLGFGIGGVGQVRALSPLYTTGRQRVSGSLEWRHRYAAGLSAGLLHLAWITGWYGVLFVDAALISDDWEGFGSLDALHVGVGYGFRVTWLALGVTPMVFAIDVAYPVYAGAAGPPPHGQPVSLTLGLQHTF